MMMQAEIQNSIHGSTELAEVRKARNPQAQAIEPGASIPFSPPRSSRLRGKGSANSAFTMIEMLVVMAIILILIGLLFAGMKQWQANANRQTTVQRMQMLQGMMGELEAQGRNQFQTQWFFNFINNPPYSIAPNNIPLAANNYCNVNKDYVPTPPSPLIPETLVVSSTPTPWLNNRAQAIEDTSVTIMSMLAVIPNNARALQSLPSNMIAPGPTVFTVQPTLPFPQFAVLPPAAGTTFGPVLLDGWGNPIIFVPASGLSNVYTSTNTSSPALLPPIQSPDHRPFWVSAGPDGDFVRGDDNIYSFSQ
jgi:prepilin-type N-terminal cleavage/methylation domain-containing protein